MAKKVTTLQRPLRSPYGNLNADYTDENDNAWPSVQAYLDSVAARHGAAPKRMTILVDIDGVETEMTNRGQESTSVFVPADGSGISDAPSDGKAYVRKDEEWVEGVEKSTLLIDKTPVERGLKGGYIATAYGTTATLTYTDTEEGVNIQKSGAVNATIRFKLTSITTGGTYRIRFSANKTVTSGVFIYDNSTLVHTQPTSNNAAEFDFAYSPASSVNLVIGFQMLYKISNIDVSLSVVDTAEIGVSVKADNISQRVSDLENSQIPCIIGSTNTFIGVSAGKNTIEREGGETLQEKDDGKYNVAIGKEAMLDNIYGDHSVAVGFCALKHNTTGNHNVAVGEDSLFENKTGLHNVAIGAHAGQNIGKSQQSMLNTVIGSNTSRSLDNASSVVIIGGLSCNSQWNSGIDPSAISDAVIIGTYAGVKADNLTNIIIIGKSCYATKSGQIVIGDTNYTEVIIAGKKINFNQDGTVTWTSIE